jgi:histidyl-tRNA synthetase
MTSYEENFTKAGFAVLQRCTLEHAPANPRERAEMVAKALGVGREQILKARAVCPQEDLEDSVANDTRRITPARPYLILLPVDVRVDLQLVSKVMGEAIADYPADDVRAVYGTQLDCVTPLAPISTSAIDFQAPTDEVIAAVTGDEQEQVSVIADGRVFDQEQVVIPSGDPLIELLVASDNLKAFLGGDAVRVIDLESAKKGKAGVIEPRVLKGFRDYLPDEMLPRQAMIATITAVFERFGFAPLQTPALEYSDILLGKLGADAEKLLFRFDDNGGRDVCLRYDLTVPLARVAAQYPDLPKPFKRYQIAPVWRAEKPGRGRFREFFQCDCDVVGSPSLLYDAECIALDFAVMQALGVQAEVRFNNRKVLAALGATLSVSDDRQMAAIFRTIDKIPAQGKERVRELLKTDAACSDEQVAKIMQFVAIAGTNDEMLGQLSALLGAGAAQAVEELRRVLDYASALSPQQTALRLDFSIARGLDYYTGTVYETFLTDLPGTGSVMSGGRYDTLIERFLGKPMPAVGISVGIDRLFSYLVELGKVKKSAVTSRVCVVPMDAACLTPALKVLGQFRAAGVASEMVLDNDQKPKLDKQLSLAGKKGIPFAAIIGGNEAAKGTVMLKDLAARQQKELSVDAAVAELRHGR